MPERCIGNCLLCGKCAGMPILEAFNTGVEGHEPRGGCGVAVDLGTTTVVMALLDLSNGTVAARHSFINPQRAFGPDVISRIGAANEGHSDELRRMITEAVSDGIDELTASAPPEKVVELAVAGNTAMTYLLLGYPCGSLGAYPFIPAYGPPDSYELRGVPARICPWLAAFVGGDITAGLLYVLTEGKRRFMLIDLGTNGETALYDDGRLTVTSTAAGPAFEGGGDGSEDDGTAHPLTGASNILRELARMVRTGQVSENGLLGEGKSALTQQRVRSLQLAKSAVRSGIEILLETAGLNGEDLDAVYLAGGIGQAINIADAVDTGLLPPALRGKARAVGNASLGGAARLLLAPSQTAAETRELLKCAAEINLAAHPKFNEYFIRYMGL